MIAKRGRPPIKPSIRRYIYLEANRPNTSREVLAQQLIDFIENKMNELAPTFETMKREISNARHSPLTDEDKPWRISTLPDYEIPPQSLPRVLQIYMDRTKDGICLTIREARWIGRLAFVVKDNEMLYDHALQRAEAERILRTKRYEFTDISDDIALYSEMTGKSFSAEDMDNIRSGQLKALQKQEEIWRDFSKKQNKEAQNERTHTSKG